MIRHPSGYRSIRMLTFAVLIALMGAKAGSGAAWSQEVPGCGNLKNAYGPYDYRDPSTRGSGKPLELVESGHFNDLVKAMNPRGNTGLLIGDLDYTLRAFPNHHRALEVVTRYALAPGTKRWANPYVQNADCYFARAVAFAADDAVVRVLYGSYLTKQGNRAEAKKQFESALEVAPTSMEINYAAALFFLDEGDVAKARTLAKLAYDGGYPLKGLKRKLDEIDSKDSEKK